MVGTIGLLLYKNYGTNAKVGRGGYVDFFMVAAAGGGVAVAAATICAGFLWWRHTQVDSSSKSLEVVGSSASLAREPIVASGKNHNTGAGGKVGVAHGLVGLSARGEPKNQNYVLLPSHGESDGE